MNLKNHQISVKSNIIFPKILLIFLYGFLILDIYMFKNNLTNEDLNEAFNITEYINKKFLNENIQENMTDYFLVLRDNQTKIEKIFFLIGILPFLNKELYINKRYKNLYSFFGMIYKVNNRHNNIIFINKNDLNYISRNFNSLLFYKWEFIPDRKYLSYLRHIINCYYEEKCLKIFDKALNYNFQNYFELNKEKLSFKEINELTSKF